MYVIAVKKSNISLTDKEIKLLFEMEKKPIKRASVNFPIHGNKVVVDLEGNERVFFKADINRRVRKNKSGKANYQVRYKNVVKIRRLDLKGNHKNPEGPAPSNIFSRYEGYEFVEEDHVHIYVDGYDSRWALPLRELPEIGISNTDSLSEKLVKFFDYCNIINLRIVDNPTLF